MSFNEWKEYTLGDFAELRKEQVPPNGYDQLYIGLEHIEQQSLRLNGIGRSKNVLSTKFKFYSGDVLYGRLRPYFRKVYQPKFDGVCSTEIYVIKNKFNVDKKFLFYLAASEDFTNIANSGSTGTHMPRADWNQLVTSKWLIPADIREQQKLASILSSLDDKIELNNQTNQTIEAITHTLFMEMCLPKDDELPKGWRVGTLGEIYRTTSGGTPSRAKLEYYENGVIQWIKSKELNNTFIINAEEKITEVALKNSSAKMLPVYSVLIAMYGATVGEIGITSTVATCNQAICAFLPNDNYPYTYIYHFLKLNKEGIISKAVGSAQQNISQELLKSINITIPTATIVQEYHKIVAPLFEKINTNLKEIQSLTTIRDSILPKLMKGEIVIN